MRRFPKTLPVALLICVALAHGQTGKVERTTNFADVSPSAGNSRVLDPNGYRLSLDDGTLVCTIWLRKNTPAQPSKTVQGALYSQLPDSAMIGIVSFPQATTDYRGQAIKAGAYTLRYALMPADGNHLGVAPNRDFLLLIPESSDSDPEKVYKFDDLVGASRTAAGTHHPAPLSLAQPDHGTAAAFVKDDEDHWIFSAGLKLSNGDEVPFALVIKGTAPQ